MEKYHDILVNAFKSFKIEKDLRDIETDIESIYTLDEIPRVIYRIMDLKNGNFKKDALLKNIRIIVEDNMYDTDIYQTEKNELKIRDEFISNPFTVEEGVMQCNKCGSKKTYSQSKQVRSADEGFTTFCMCSNCGAKWRIN